MGSFNPPSNITGYADIAVYVNQVTGNMFWTLILVALFIISFISMKHHPNEKAFAGACYITSIAAILLRILTLVSDQVMFIFIILSLISAVMLFISSRQ